MGDLFSFSILGAVEGLTEFLPISSTGHLIIARDLFGLTTGSDLAVDAVLQLATMLALVVYFSKDLWNLALLKNKPLLLALAVGTVPGVMAGLMLEDIMGTLFRNSALVAYALIVGSMIMLAAERWGPKLSKALATLPWHSGLIVGLFQALAVVPGMSRSGMTTAGGMFLGYTRAESTYFGFLLSVPILVGAGLKKLYELYSTSAVSTIGPELALGSVLAFLFGIATIHLFLSIVRRTPLTVFVVYRLILAVALLVFIA